MKWFCPFLPALVAGFLAVGLADPGASAQGASGEKLPALPEPISRDATDPALPPPAEIGRPGGPTVEIQQLVPPPPPGEPLVRTGPVILFLPGGSTAVQVAGQRLLEALRVAGYISRRATLQEYGQRRTSPQPSLTFVVACRSRDLPTLFPEREFRQREPEAFGIEVLPERTVVVWGADFWGTAYGLLALAERVAVGEDPVRVAPVQGGPRFGFRAITIPAGIFRSENREWTHSQPFWGALFSDLVADRWNAVIIPAPPGNGAVDPRPETSIISAAAELGLAVVIDLEAAPAGSVAGSTNEIRSWLGMSGAGNLRMSISVGEITDRDVARVAALIEAFPEAGIHLRIPRGPGPEDVIAWLNGLSLGRLYVWPASGSAPTEWTDRASQHPRVSAVLFEAPAAPSHLTRWGDPEAVEEWLGRIERAGSAGFALPPDEWLFGPDRSGTEYQREKAKSWAYLHEKHWFPLWLWGRGGYEGRPADELVTSLFVSRFGETAGPAVFRSLVAATRIPATLTAFFPALESAPNFLDGAWLGPVRPIPAAPDLAPATGRFLSARVLRDLEVRPGASIGVPEFAGMRMAGLGAERDPRTDPLELAEVLEKLSHDCRASARVPYERGYSPVNLTLSRSADLELQMIANLGRFYASQLRAAVEGCYETAVGEQGPDGLESPALDAAAREWDFVRRVTELLYLPLQASGGAFHWKHLPEPAVPEGAGIPEVSLQRVEWKVLGPVPFGALHLQVFEEVCSTTEVGQLEARLLSPAVPLSWRDAAVRVLAATPEGALPTWCRRMNRSARFVNLERAYPGAVEGVGFAWHRIHAEEESPAILHCALGTPDKVWLNGELIHERTASGALYSGVGARVRLRRGANHLIFRSDLTREGGGYWGAALDIVREPGRPEAED